MPLDKTIFQKSINIKILNTRKSKGCSQVKNKKGTIKYKHYRKTAGRYLNTII